MSGDGLDVDRPTSRVVELSLRQCASDDRNRAAAAHSGPVVAVAYSDAAVAVAHTDGAAAVAQSGGGASGVFCGALIFSEDKAAIASSDGGASIVCAEQSISAGADLDVGASMLSGESPPAGYSKGGTSTSSTVFEERTAIDNSDDGQAELWVESVAVADSDEDSSMLSGERPPTGYYNGDTYTSSTLWEERTAVVNSDNGQQEVESVAVAHSDEDSSARVPTMVDEFEQQTQQPAPPPTRRAAGLARRNDGGSTRTRGKPRVCTEPGCSYSAKSYSGLWFHKKTKHLGVRYPCPHPGCAYTGTRRSNTRRHYEAKHEAKAFKCPYVPCSKSFDEEIDLNTHVYAKHESTPLIFSEDKAAIASSDGGASIVCAERSISGADADLDVGASMLSGENPPAGYSNGGTSTSSTVSEERAAVVNSGDGQLDLWVESVAVADSNGQPGLWVESVPVVHSDEDSSARVPTMVDEFEQQAQQPAPPPTSRAAGLARRNDGGSTRTRGKPYVCTEPGCSYSAKSYSGLWFHKKTKHLGVRFPCPHPGCTYTGTQRSNTRRHYEAKHEAKAFKCPYVPCSKSFDEEIDLNTHVYAKHEGTPTACRVSGCSYVAKNERSLKRHHTMNHGSGQQPPRSRAAPYARADAANGADGDADGRRTWRCEHPGCARVFTRKYRLKAHFQTIHGAGGALFACKVRGCSCVFKSKRYLTKHMNAFHEGVVYSAKIKSDLEQHDQEVHDGERYKCQHFGCSYSTTGKHNLHNLNMHVRKVHDGVHVGYPCEHPNCSYVASVERALTKHVDMVHKIKYPCVHPNCSYNASTKAKLVYHTRLVHEAVSYKCEHLGCSYVAKRKDCLKTHVQAAHERPTYPCEHSGCSYVATQKGYLRKHVRFIHDRARYPCEYPDCSYVTTQKSYLRIHVRTVHKGGVGTGDHGHVRGESSGVVLSGCVEHADRSSPPAGGRGYGSCGGSGETTLLTPKASY